MTFALLPFLPSSFDFIAFVALLVVSLLMIFVGSRFTQGLAYVAVGLVGGSIGFSLGLSYGSLGSMVGFISGFLLGGAAAVFLLPLGLGLVLGFMGYQVAASLTAIAVIPFMAALVAFTYGLLLTDLLLPVVSSAGGGLIFYTAAVSHGVSSGETLLAAATLSVVGVIVQTVPFGRANGAIRRRPTLVKSRPRRSIASR